MLNDYLLEFLFFAYKGENWWKWWKNTVGKTCWEQNQTAIFITWLSEFTPKILATKYFFFLCVFILKYSFERTSLI